MCLPRIRSSASSRASEPVCERRVRRTSVKPARSAVRSSAVGKRSRSIRSIDGKSSFSQKASKYDGSKVATAKRPPGSSTRAASANARGRSTRCATSHIVARSNQPSLNGSCSAEPSFRPALPTRERATSSISGEAVDAPGLRDLGELGEEAPGATADVEHAPPGRSASRISVSATSRQFASYGRSRS